MSINSTQYEINLKSIVEVLAVIAGQDMASVQINSDGMCILRTGVLHTEHLTVKEFAKRLDETMVKFYA